ncbi:MAG: phosphoribosylglycinamide formyltransferase [Microcystaceae cyanobacterium]
MQNDIQQGLISPQVSAEDIRSDQPLKLGVMASGSGSNYEAIAKAIEDHTLNAQINVLIYNNPKATVKQRANKWQTPTVLLNHRDYETREALDHDIVKVFREHEVEWVIMAGWMRIITDVLLDAYPNRVLNIHPSLLPSFKGIHAIEQALAAKVKVTGCTVHIAHLDVDSGPIVMQAAVPILPDDTPDTLHARVQIQEHTIFPLAIALAAQLAQS